MAISFRKALLTAFLAFGFNAQALADGASAAQPYKEPLSAEDMAQVKTLFKQLIDAENNHDLATVKPLVWNSPSTLFVAKTATAAEGNWAGFWGAEVVMQHFHDLYQGPFRMEPDYGNQKITGLTADIAQIYTPVSITVAYAGQTPVPKPFIIIMDWVRTPDGWRMASDIAIPVPPAPAKKGSVTMPWINLTLRQGALPKEKQHAVMARLTDALMFWEKVPNTPRARNIMKGWVYEVSADADYVGGSPQHDNPYYFIEVRIPIGRLDLLAKQGIIRDFTQVILEAEELDAQQASARRIWVTINELEQQDWGIGGHTDWLRDYTSALDSEHQSN